MITQPGGDQNLLSSAERSIVTGQNDGQPNIEEHNGRGDRAGPHTMKSATSSTAQTAEVYDIVSEQMNKYTPTQI